MVVRYIGHEPHNWLVKAREYVVLAVSATPNGKDPLTFMLHHPDEGGAFDWGWWPTELFETSRMICRRIGSMRTIRMASI